MIKVRISDFNPACNYRLPKIQQKPFIRNFSSTAFSETDSFFAFEKSSKNVIFNLKL